MKTFIIIGSSGFVGKSLNDYLKDKKKINNLKIINYSRSEKKDFLKTKNLPKADYIFFLINKKNSKLSDQIFDHFKKLLLNYSKQTKILFFSSGAVYGYRDRQEKIKENESLNLSKIYKLNGYKKNYALQKIRLEEKFKQLSKLGFKISVIRGFTFIGKHILKYNYLISQIINAVNFKKKLLIKNNNVQRSYMHANDMCKWMITIIKKSSIKCPIYNVGSDQKVDIQELINFLNNKYKSKILININRKKKDFYIPNVNLVKNKLKLKITINFKDAIKSLIN